MNYQNYSVFSNTPPNNENIFDDGTGIKNISKNNMTLQDIYRTSFLLTQEHNKNYQNIAKEAIKGVHCDSEISKLFFSGSNIKRLQKQIKKEVFKRTKGQFRLDIDQDEKDLIINMRGIYLQNARFLPGQTVRQVKRLNEKVVSEVVPPMITEIKQYYGYLREINKPLTPIPRPINVSSAGRRTLPSVTSIWQI